MPEKPRSLQERRSASVSRSLVIFAEACRARLMKAFAGAEGFPSVDFPNAALFRNLGLDEQIPLSALARRAGVSRQAMQKLARKLASSGHVHLVADPVDRRRLNVCFTPKGRAMIRASLKVYDRFDAEFAAAIGARRLRQFGNALNDLSTKWPRG